MRKTLILTPLLLAALLGGSRSAAAAPPALDAPASQSVTELDEALPPSPASASECARRRRRATYIRYRGRRVRVRYVKARYERRNGRLYRVRYYRRY